jgi:broad specificity phosphatase PhoE
MTEAALILVRHARPRIDPDVPPSNWELCPDGRIAAIALSDKIAAYSPACVVSSNETKAVETAKILAEQLHLPLELDPGLVEHKRPSASFGTEAEFQTRIAEIFRHPHVPAPGGESIEQACERLAAALARHAARPLVAVTHGTVLSLYVGRLLGLDAHDLWRNLHTPDAFVFDAENRLIERIGCGSTTPIRQAHPGRSHFSGW